MASIEILIFPLFGMNGHESSAINKGWYGQSVLSAFNFLTAIIFGWTEE